LRLYPTFETDGYSLPHSGLCGPFFFFFSWDVSPFLTLTLFSSWGYERPAGRGLTPLFLSFYLMRGCQFLLKTSGLLGTCPIPLFSLTPLRDLASRETFVCLFLFFSACSFLSIPALFFFSKPYFFALKSTARCTKGHPLPFQSQCDLSCFRHLFRNHFSVPVNSTTGPNLSSRPSRTTHFSEFRLSFVPPRRNPPTLSTQQTRRNHTFLLWFYITTLSCFSLRNPPFPARSPLSSPLYPTQNFRVSCPFFLSILL